MPGLVRIELHERRGVGKGAQRRPSVTKSDSGLPRPAAVRARLSARAEGRFVRRRSGFNRSPACARRSFRPVISSLARFGSTAAERTLTAYSDTPEVSRRGREGAACSHHRLDSSFKRARSASTRARWRSTPVSWRASSCSFCLRSSWWHSLEVALNSQGCSRLCRFSTSLPVSPQPPNARVAIVAPAASMCQPCDLIPEIYPDCVVLTLPWGVLGTVRSRAQSRSRRSNTTRACRLRCVCRASGNEERPSHGPRYSSSPTSISANPS